MDSPAGTSWQKILAEAITKPADLCRLLDLSDAYIAEQAAKDFELRVPKGFIARMEKGNPHDPLLQQVLPQFQEMQIIPGYTHDPLAEKQANPIPGLLHKYANRVLLLLAGKCAINCRYCFRRHFAYTDLNGKEGWQAMLSYIEADSSILEVIYSGGDPLLHKDQVLAELTQRIAEIPHVSLLRIHTRLPIVIPERITTSLIQWMTSTRLRPIMVLHCNHPNEIDETVIHAITRLREAGITVLNQTVLLKGINDQKDTLVALNRQLFFAGILPYYLHILDAVQGAAHFSISMDQAKQLMAEIREELPGYLVPRLVQEKPGMKSKCWVV